MKSKEIVVGEEYALNDGNSRPNKYTVRRVIVRAIGVERSHRGYSMKAQMGIAVDYLEPDTGKPIVFLADGEGGMGKRQTVYNWQEVVRPQVIKQTWAEFKKGQETLKRLDAERKENDLREFDRLTKMVDLGNAELGGEYFDVQDPKHGYGTRIRALSSIATEELLQAIIGIRGES